MSQSRDFVEVDGLRIAFERAGDGPPLVLLHGYVGDSRATWQHQLDALSDEFTVVAWDAPGAGQSSDPPESFSLGDFADRLAGFVAALGLERPHVAGLSLGGGLALELYRRHPAVPRTLVLASAYAGWAGSLAPEETERRLRQVLDLADRPPEEFVAAVRPTMFAAGVPQETADAFAASVGEFHPSGSARWRARSPRRICATSCPGSRCRRCCSTAIRTCAPRLPSARRCTPRSPRRGSWSCPASVT